MLLLALYFLPSFCAFFPFSRDRVVADEVSEKDEQISNGEDDVDGDNDENMQADERERVMFLSAVTEHFVVEVRDEVLAFKCLRQRLQFKLSITDPLSCGFRSRRLRRKTPDISFILLGQKSSHKVVFRSLRGNNPFSIWT